MQDGYARWVCKVNFIAGEGKENPPTQLVQVNDAVEKPAIILHESLNFKGWSEFEAPFQEADLWNFWTNVTKRNMTLYALWAADVNFDPNGGVFVADAPIATVYQNAVNKTINVPVKPTREGHAFVGWFMDEALENPFLFRGEENATKVTRNMILYAKWQETKEPIDTTLYELKVEIQQGGIFESDQEFSERNGNRNYEGAFKAGTVIRFEAKPDSGYSFDGFHFNKGTDMAVSLGVVDFAMPNEKVNLVIKFKKNSSSGGSGGGGRSHVVKTPEVQPPTVPENTNNNTSTPFVDTQNHWAQEAINFVANNNLFNGTETNQFSPDEEMSKSMFITVLSRMSGEPISGYENKFRDVEGEAWYRDSIAWATAKGLIYTTSDGNFDPDAAITRQDMAVLLDRYMLYQKQSLPKKENGASFIDEGDIATYAKDAVLNMEKVGIITGKPGNYFDPNRTAERAEVACMFQKYVSLLENLPNSQ